MEIKNVTVGTDFELFLQNKKTKEIVSAEGIIKGTKWEPFNFDPSNKYFATSLDNVLAEACIPPAKDKETFRKNIEHSRSYIESILPKRLCTVALPAARLRPKHLKTENAQLFGCESDLNVWTKEYNPKPSAEATLRSAGGHIHVGYDDNNWVDSENIVKALDLFLSVPSILQEPPNERKNLYGKAGAFRFKEEYGVEYRSISNYYLQSADLTDWVFAQTMEAIDFINEGRIQEIEDSKELIIHAINNNDAVAAHNLINQFNLQLV